MFTTEPEKDDALRSTLPKIQISVQGFTNQYGAECLGREMLFILQEVGEYIDISTLDGVTIAIDYDEALRDLDRGVEDLPPETRTNDEALAGVGKCVVVMRDEVVKTHIVFAAGPICPIVIEEAERDDNDFRTAIAIIAHECAHVEENAYREDHFPGVHFQRPSGQFIRDHQQHFAEAWWGEYAVCRMSAGFAVQEEARFRDNLALRLTDCRLKVRDAIRSYRRHGDVVRVFNEVGGIILEPLRIASYLIGHLDGVNETDTLREIAPEVPTDDEAIITAIDQLAEQLRRLWDTRGDWESYDALVDLGALGFDLLRQFGVHAAPQLDGQAYINVPFTADSFPPGTTQGDILRAMMGGLKA
ncbi:hypothetical protein [Shinella sumterensis]|uniref:hypothetical protein n=1 Tax=Shinella sumterensis TaxID=1967501 RepID=UPI003F875131